MEISSDKSVKLSSSRVVPKLSLLGYLQGGQLDKLRFIDNFFFGLKEFGFIVLQDHLIEQNKVDHAYDIIHEFFNLSPSKKINYSGVSGGQRGYTPFKTEHARDNSNPDLKEFWHVGREILDNHPYSSYYPKNIWPSEIQNFKPILMQLYNAMDLTSQVLLTALGIALEVPEDYFSEMIKNGNSILRAIHYPPTVGQDTKNSIRAAPHGDINLITLLVGATDSGLELLDHNNQWLPIQSAKGDIVVDTGDMMSRITNDILPSTIHRVVNPVNQQSRRYSMPYFVHPHPKAILSCIESCKGSGAKYLDISSHDFLMQRLYEIGLM
ncbi:MAG: isopenicillin N synthase family oxygenase [Halobacteriovoraceae bacterium]|nr:isopenicillin N synthase family oxygenase [Halobacteriovoraceae bacterium]